MAMSTVFEVVCWAMGLAHTPMPTLRTFYMVRTLNSYAANNGRLIPKKKTKRKPGDRRDVHRANLGTDGTFTYFSLHPNAESSSWRRSQAALLGRPPFFGASERAVSFSRWATNSEVPSGRPV